MRKSCKEYLKKIFSVPSISLPKVSLPQISFSMPKIPLPSVKLPEINISLKKIGVGVGAINTILFLLVNHPSDS